MLTNYDHARLAGCLVSIAPLDPYPLMREQSVGMISARCASRTCGLRQGAHSLACDGFRVSYSTDIAPPKADIVRSNRN